MLTYYGDALFGCNIIPTCTPGTYNLTVNATDIYGKYNNSVNVTVTVLPSIYGAPEITSWYPAGTEIYDGEGATRTFNVIVNQTVNVSWLINGTEVQKDTSVTSASYTNTSAAVGTWNVSATVTNVNGTDMQVWVWNVTNVTPEAPEIAAFAPGTPVYDIEGATRTFNVTVNQTVNVSWLINGTEVQLNEGVTEAAYTNTSAAVGTWNVSAIVTNANGADMQAWMWIVTNVTPEAPEIASYAPGTPVQDIEGATRTFNVTVNQTVNVSWQINGTEVQLNENATEATYTNTSAAEGTWNVSAIVTNANGADMQVWVWNVISPPYEHTDAGVTVDIELTEPGEIEPLIPPGTDLTNAIVINVNVTDDTSENSTDDAYTDITIYVGELDVETCEVYKDGSGFLVEVDYVTELPTVNGTAKFSRDVANNSIIVRLYVGDPLLGVVPSAIKGVFDTGTGTYPSIAGIHNGTITTNVTITVQKLYTYPCAGTGGHTEHVIIANNTGFILAEADWDGYQVDGHNITFDSSFTLVANETYNYTIRTGSYPQIIHATSKTVAGGTITCTSFVDTNGNEYDDWIPAIRLGE